MRRVLGAVGRVLVTVGLLLLLFVAYQLWGTGIYQARAQNDLEQQFKQSLERSGTTTTTSPIPTTAATATTSPPPESLGPLTAPPEGDAVGRIGIPKIGVDQYVVEGVNVDDLRKGPGHYPSTPLPGVHGTVAIAGHRTTYLAPFRHIDQIENGDEIRIEMPYASFTYVAQRHEIVDPSDVGIIKPVGYDRLVLTACHPPYSAAHRYAIFAKLTRIDLFDISGESRWPAP